MLDKRKFESSHTALYLTCKLDENKVHHIQNEQWVQLKKFCYKYKQLNSVLTMSKSVNIGQL